MSAISREQQILLWLAQDVWLKRGIAKQANIPYNEETITENLLISFVSFLNDRVRVVAFNKKDEARNGSDWLISFENKDGGNSVTFQVQAKRLDNRDSNYLGLKKTVGSSPRVLQIKRLIESSITNNCIPFYAFYNHLSDKNKVPRQCKLSTPAEAFGIALADAFSVRKKLSPISFQNHSRHSFPLHCLLCNCGGSHGSLVNIAQVVQSNVMWFGLGSGMDGAKRLIRSLEVEIPSHGLGFIKGRHPLVETGLQYADHLRRDEQAPKPSQLRNVAGAIIVTGPSDP